MTNLGTLPGGLNSSAGGPLWVVLQASRYDAIQFWRHGAEADPGHGTRARCHFIEHQPEGEQVGPRVRRTAERLLRRHVAGRAHGGTRIGKRLLAAVRRAQLSQAKIEDLDVVSPGDENVGRLDVAVNDPRGVGGIQRVGDPPRPGRRAARRRRVSGCGAAHVPLECAASTGTKPRKNGRDSATACAYNPPGAGRPHSPKPPIAGCGRGARVSYSGVPDGGARQERWGSTSRALPGLRRSRNGEACLCHPQPPRQIEPPSASLDYSAARDAHTCSPSSEGA